MFLCSKRNKNRTSDILLHPMAADLVPANQLLMLSRPVVHRLQGGARETRECGRRAPVLVERDQLRFTGGKALDEVDTDLF